MENSASTIALPATNDQTINQEDDTSLSVEPGKGIHSYKNKQKKRRKKFIANAKGFGKTGNFGRGTRLEGNEWTYFINIMDAIRLGFDSLDDKLSMATNVFAETVDKEIHISSNQIASTVIEHLLPYTEPTDLERFHKTFAGDQLRPICSDKFASHILQKIITVSFLRSVSKLQQEAATATTTQEMDTEPPTKKRKPQITAQLIPDEKNYNLTVGSFPPEHIENCAKFVVKISKYLLNNLEDFVWDSYACHVIRTCLMCLCGLFVAKAKDFITSGGQQRNGMISAGNFDKEKSLIVPGEWLEILQEYAGRLQAWPQFPDFPYDELSSGLLQSLCTALRFSDKNELKHLGKRILNDSFCLIVKSENNYIGGGNDDIVKYGSTIEDDIKMEETEEKEDIKPNDVKTITNHIDEQLLPKVFTTEPSIRLLECLITSAGPKLLIQLYAKLFSGRLIRLSEMKSANFTVQKLLDNIKEKTDLEFIFDELSPNIEQLLRIGYTGVVNALAQACLRLSVKQGAFIQSLQTALDCVEKERCHHFTVLTMKLKPFGVEEKKSQPNHHQNHVHLHGSLICQAMLKFNKPIKLVQSMLDTKPEELMELFCDPCGSHVVDAFLSSKFIGEKSREKFIKHMNGTFLQMAMSRHGSRAVEAMFESSGDQQRNRIVKELAEKINQLNGTPTGRLLNYKFRVDTYRLSPAQWKVAFNRETKVDKLFKDII